GDGRAALPLAALHGRRLLAVAGLAAPEKFFAMLEQAGLTIDRLPLPDHHAYAALPWPPGTAEVVTTEKDAVKIDPSHIGATRVWVVPLDLTLPSALIGQLVSLLPAPTSP
ncbi:MAG: tetraacyldisaccharide 4'-kinase, partial [Rubrivivax sp.]|nr:tetraacyldisaccharide 4'-kinase [Rubrivivax sp.]